MENNQTSPIVDNIPGITMKEKTVVIDSTVVNKEILVAAFIAYLLQHFEEIRYTLESKDAIAIYQDGGEYAKLGEVRHLTVSYLERSFIQLSEKETYYVSSATYFPKVKIGEAICNFIQRISENKDYSVDSCSGYSLEQIKKMDTVVFLSHTVPFGHNPPNLRDNLIQILKGNPTSIIEIKVCMEEGEFCLKTVCDEEYTAVGFELFYGKPNDSIEYGVQYYPIQAKEEAVDVLLSRKKSGLTYPDSLEMFRKFERKDLPSYASGVLKFDSHYDYLDNILDAFWMEVFGKTPQQMWDVGIVGAHGDKCYGYRRDWEEHNIPFQHGALLFLLTYTKEFGENEKPKSCEWVIENYQKYLPKIKAAEEKTIQEKFTYNYLQPLNWGNPSDPPKEIIGIPLVFNSNPSK